MKTDKRIVIENKKYENRYFGNDSLFIFTAKELS